MPHLQEINFNIKHLPFFYDLLVHLSRKTFTNLRDTDAKLLHIKFVCFPLFLIGVLHPFKNISLLS